VERDLGTVQHHQQLVVVGMQPCRHAVERDEADEAKKDAVEPARNAMGRR
jgi:hypothetical protein